MTPPCNTHSRALVANRTGPRPMRDKAHPWGFPWFTGRLLDKCNKANISIRRSFEAIKAGWYSKAKTRYISEHPQDLEKRQNGEIPASIWQTLECRETVEETEGTTGALFQCKFPPRSSPKPTRVASNMESTELLWYRWPEFDKRHRHVGPLPRSCGHKHTRFAIGKSSTRTFKTSALAAYPKKMCESLAYWAAVDWRGRQNKHPKVGRWKRKQLNRGFEGPKKVESDTGGEIKTNAAQPVLEDPKVVGVVGTDTVDDKADGGGVDPDETLTTTSRFPLGNFQ